MMGEMKREDPFGFMIELCQISPSQEELLRCSPFVGETPTPTSPHHQPSPTSVVNLGTDSDLGFSELQLTQGFVSELVAGCSRGVKRHGVTEISKCQFNKLGGEKELSLKDGLGELPLKKLKLSEKNSGFNSSRACFGVEAQRVEVGMGNCEGKLVSHTESPCNFGVDLQPQKNVLPRVRMSVDAGNEGNACGCGEISMEKFLRQKRSDEQPGLRVWPSLIPGRLENATKELESGKGEKKDQMSIFDVLKVLKENCDEDGIVNVSLLGAAKIRGITFPRPRWYLDNGNCRK